MDGQKIEIQHACWLLHSFWKLLVCLCCLQHWILLNCEYCFAAQSTHFRFRLQKTHSRLKILEIPRVPHWQFDCARFACSCGQFELKKLKYISTRHPRPEFSGHVHVQVRCYCLLRPLDLPVCRDKITLRNLISTNKVKSNQMIYLEYYFNYVIWWRSLKSYNVIRAIKMSYLEQRRRSIGLIYL